MDEYLVSKAFHILAAVFFVGNIVTAAFWKVRADRTGNAHTIAHANLQVSKADLLFTAPGVVVLILTGIAMVARGPWVIAETRWLMASIVLLALTILLWAFVLLPTQRRMAQLSAEGAASGTLPAAYREASRRWAMVGGVATLLPVVIVFLMVLKPF